MNKKKKELQVELELSKIGLDINEIDNDSIDILYNFINNIYSSIKKEDEIINNTNLISDLADKILDEGLVNDNEKDT
jgi:hypothetical protein